MVLNYASDDRSAQNTADEIRSQGGEVMLCKGDVSKRADMQALAALTLATYSRIDILCANAGIYPKADLETMTEEQWDQVNDVNYKGTFLSVQACLPQMITQRYGKIVVISSTTGVFTSLAREVHYGASKAGQVGFVRSASLPLAKHNITINAILPGIIDTEGIATDEDSLQRAKLVQAIPMQRLGEPLDIAYGAVYLSCDESRYITGQTLTIDGGLIVPELPIESFGM